MARPEDMRDTMIAMNWIRQDEQGWHFDAYFDYLAGAAADLPDTLREFALDLGNYALRGRDSLHDARMSAFRVEKSAVDGAEGATVSIEVVLLDQQFEGEMLMTYSGVVGYLLQEALCSDDPSVDVLVHEVSVVEPGRYRHTVLFDNGGGYAVEFSGFTRARRERAPSRM